MAKKRAIEAKSLFAVCSIRPGGPARGGSAFWGTCFGGGEWSICERGGLPLGPLGTPKTKENANGEGNQKRSRFGPLGDLKVRFCQNFTPGHLGGGASTDINHHEEENLE